MKAKEVLHRYAMGERNFCNMNLRGANFNGQDLAGANFSEADIRSANFKDANLRRTNFASAKAGLQRRWLAVQWLLIAVLAVVSGVSQGFSGAIATLFLDSSSFNTLEQTIGLGIYLLLLVITYVAISLQGFSIRAFGSIMTAFAGIFAIAITAAIAIVVTDAIAIAFTGAVIGAVAVAFAFAIVGAIAVAFAGAFAFAFAFAGAIIVAITVAFAVAFAVTSSFAGTSVVAFLVAGAGLLFSIFVGWRVAKEDEKFDTLRSFGLVLATIGGTSFSGADLTSASFAQAYLRSTSFANSRKNNTLLNHVCWNGGKYLNRSRLGTSILQDRRVRILLTIPEKGYKQNLVNANLRGANLSSVTLEKADLTRSILSDALLKGAVLKDAILTEVQAVRTDFTGAYLTGATLESWNIDSTTIFKDIDCDYVYLLEHPKENDDRERRPHDITKVFQPGDFEKLFKEVQDDVQLLIRNGANPVALRSAFQKIRENYPELSEDVFQGFQRRDSDFLVTVKVPPSIDKGQFQRDWDSGYQVGLRAGREESAALLASVEKRADGLEAIALTIAQNPPSIQNNQSITSSDHSQTIEVKGKVADSVIGQGDRNHLSNQTEPKTDPAS